MRLYDARTGMSRENDFFNLFCTSQCLTHKSLGSELKKSFSNTGRAGQTSPRMMRLLKFKSDCAAGVRSTFQRCHRTVQKSNVERQADIILLNCDYLQPVPQ